MERFKNIKPKFKVGDIVEYTNKHYPEFCGNIGVIRKVCPIAAFTGGPCHGYLITWMIEGSSHVPGWGRPGQGGGGCTERYLRKVADGESNV